jgi:hypothetical protein
MSSPSHTENGLSSSNVRNRFLSDKLLSSSARLLDNSAGAFSWTIPGGDHATICSASDEASEPFLGFDNFGPADDREAEWLLLTSLVFFEFEVDLCGEAAGSLIFPLGLGEVRLMEGDDATGSVEVAEVDWDV